jgi:hypothetical protein
VSDTAVQTPPVETTTPPVETTAPTAVEAPAVQPNGEAAPTSLLSEAAQAPEPFDAEKITIPEGMTKDDALWSDFTKFATENGLTGSAAQAAIDLAGKQVQAVIQRQNADWMKMQEDWQAQVKADPEIGGDKLAGNLQTFSKVARNPELSDPEFLADIAPVGNKLSVVRTLARWAKALSEGGPVQGTPATANGGRPQSLGEAFYGPNGPHTGGPRLS